MRRNVITIALMALLVISTAIPSFAEVSQQPPQKERQRLSAEVAALPVYITTLKDADNDQLKEAVENVIVKDVEVSKNDNDKVTALSQESRLDVDASGYQVTELDLFQKNKILQNELFAGTFENVQSLIDDGVDVSYINLFVKEEYDIPNASTLASNSNDPSYWESTCNYLGTYNGYKFLYLESAAGVNSSWVTPGNISGISWPSIIAKSAKSLIGLTKNGALSTIVVGTDLLSNLFTSTPLKITYSSAGSYLKAKVSGTLYMRDVFIRDKLNRVSGYAYYQWGRTEQTKLVVKYDAKYPTKKRTSGTYEYFDGTKTSATHTTNTPGFKGNSTLYQNILNMYNNTSGYFIYAENLNINKLVVKLLS